MVNWYVKTRVIFVSKHLVLYFKNLSFIHEIPMPSTSLLEERSVKEDMPLSIACNIQVSMFVELCWNTIFSFSKQLLTSNTNLRRNYWNKMAIKNSGTHPIAVIVLSILILDDLNLIELQYLTIHILEQEFQGQPKILKSYCHKNLFLYSTFLSIFNAWVSCYWLEIEGSWHNSHSWQIVHGLIPFLGSPRGTKYNMDF